MASSLLTGIVGYWKLDESSGNAADSAGGSLTLTNNGTTGYVSALVNNGADGGATNTTKYFNRTSNLGVTGSLSLSVWVKLTTEITSGTYGLIFLDGTSTSTAIYITYEYNSGTRRVVFTRARSGTAFDNITYNVTLGTSNWHNLVLTYDGSTVKGYVDNVATSTVASSGNGATPDVTQGFGIMASRQYVTGVISEHTSGLFDEVGVWSKELTTTEVADLYNNRNGNQYPFLNYTASASDTSTGTEGYTYLINKETITSDTSTSTETYSITAPSNTAKWTNQSKSSTTWTNLNKS